jgi:hypothetical protein
MKLRQSQIDWATEAGHPLPLHQYFPGDVGESYLLAFTAVGLGMGYINHKQKICVDILCRQTRVFPPSTRVDSRQGKWKSGRIWRGDGCFPGCQSVNDGLTEGGAFRDVIVLAMCFGEAVTSLNLAPPPSILFLALDSFKSSSWVMHNENPFQKIVHHNRVLKRRRLGCFSLYFPRIGANKQPFKY